MRIEFHVYKHIQPTPDSPRVWGSAGIKFDGPDFEAAKEKAIRAAMELNSSASKGVDFSVQKYVFSEKSKNRPVKSRVWRNGIEIVHKEEQKSNESKNFKNTRKKAA